MTSATSTHYPRTAELPVLKETKPPLLFLCHRIPYPPNKGDKIRSYHLLRHLSQHFDIHLASFVDDPEDSRWENVLREICASVCICRLDSRIAMLRSLWGFPSTQALSVPYYSDSRLRGWVASIVSDHNIRHALVFSSQMAQFLPNCGRHMQRKVIDFVDVDSDKWLQYSQQKRWPFSWIYRRESRYLLALEKQLAERFDAGLFVSCAEADLFRNLSPATADKIGFYNNGVDSEYFNPLYDHKSTVANPYPDDSIPLVFTGAMDYWPNIDAVAWFSREVLPALQQAYPKVTLTIVGGNPDKSVRQLTDSAGITVTGRVEDVRPYLKHALAAVAPMRIARGVQNKVLEAMSMSRPVLVSKKGLEGINAIDRSEVLIAESAEDYSNLVGQLLDGQHLALGQMARACIQRRFNWDENLQEVALLLSGVEECAG